MMIIFMIRIKFEDELSIVASNPDAEGPPPMPTNTIDPLRQGAICKTSPTANLECHPPNVSEIRPEYTRKIQF